MQSYIEGHSFNDHANELIANAGWTHLLNQSIISLNQMQDTSTTHENQIYATGKFAIPSIGERIGRVS